MRELVRDYLHNGLSRRGFIKKMAAAGFSAVAAHDVLDSLTPVMAGSTEPVGDAANNYKTIQGTGGEVLVEQLMAAGAGFLVVSNSSHLRNVYDALIDRPIYPILAVEEGMATAIASGYAMASGKLGVIACSVAGAPHCSSNMYNAGTANLPLLVITDMVPTEFEDREGIYGGRMLIGAATSSPKWHWLVGQSDLIPDLTRRAIRVATTAPGGPVLMTYPEDVLARKDVKATIIPQEKFNVPAHIRPPVDAVEAAAKMLLEAKNPAMYVGPEAWTSGARADCIELAELLGIPAMRVLIDSWTDCFPTSHPLFVNAEYHPNARFPRGVDVLLVLGSFMPNPGSATAIQVTIDSGEINKTHPVALPILADVRLSVRDIIEAIRSRATKERLLALAQPRIDAIREFNSKMADSLKRVAKDNWDSTPISWQRMALELDKALDPDALIVDEISTEKTKVFSYLRTSVGGRHRIGRSIQQALGWGVGLSIGAKLAEPNRQVVSVIGDGAFMFGQIEALWSMARYDVPVITVVFNNRSYNEPRQRILGKMGKQGQMGKDMACYLGSPDVDFTKLASGFGIGGEVVAAPGSIGPALQRAIKATRDGKPYLLDVLVERSGIGADSTWYPEYSVAKRRTRQV